MVHVIQVESGIGLETKVVQEKVNVVHVAPLKKDDEEESDKDKSIEE